MSREIQRLFIFIILFLLGCAAQGPVTGGPADEKGPILITVHPANSSLNIAQNQKIILTFNELLEPVSIPSSIKIEFDPGYKLKIRGQKLIIYPDKIWPKNGIVRINISRNIRDYQKNIMSKPIQLIYSTGSEIPNGTIIGEIVGHHPKTLVELGLYEWPLSDPSTFIQKVEADEKGQFQLRNIEYGEYSIAALEGVLKDMSKQMEKKQYALLSSDYISLTPDNKEERVKLLLSEPLKKLRIATIEMINQHSMNLIMDNNSKEIFTIDTLLIPGDSIFINLEKSNRLETYKIPEYSFILPEITDTLAPILSKSFFESDKFSLVFSESVQMNADAITTNWEGINDPIPFEYDNDYTISIPALADSINKIQLIGEHIYDRVGNLFADSIKTVIITRKQEEEIIIGGNIIGSVNYDDKKLVKVEAHKIGSELYYITDVVNKRFNLSNLPSGLYELWGFEVLNILDPDVYFSGLWVPYHRAAQFAMYPDTIDVRVRWDVEDIMIDFK